VRCAEFCCGAKTEKIDFRWTTKSPFHNTSQKMIFVSLDKQFCCAENVCDKVKIKSNVVWLVLYEKLYQN
jgi:hypothetical protein